VSTLARPALPLNDDIMIVDDNPANLKLLEDMLVQQGHEVRSFPLGRLALAAAMKSPPSLILLDINMPEMNGYEVCDHLKSNEKLSSIPVIFLSALNEMQDKVKAFRSGAVDYISKPFHIEEVHARVQTHLKLHQLQQTLQLQNEHLEAAVAARTRELAEANGRLTILDRSKNEFLSLISHEFRTPLNGLLGVGELILEDMPATEENRTLQGLFAESRRRILSLLDDALLLTQIDVSCDRLTYAPVSLYDAMRRAIKLAAPLAESCHVAFSPVPAGLGDILADEDLVVRALHALLETAVRFSAPSESVLLSSDGLRPALKLVIESRGKSIPGPALEKFFDLFSLSESSTPGGDLGLGPPVAFRILSLYDASVAVANRDSGGIRLTISFPHAIPETFC